MHIDRIDIRLVPTKVLGSVDLWIGVRLNGEVYDHRMTILEHDLIPWLDLYMDEARKALKGAVMTVEANRPAPPSVPP